MAGIDLFFAHRFETLVTHLSDELRPRLHAVESLFCPVDIIVPNAAVGEYLEQEIARHLGITPNLRFHRLRRFLAEHLSVEDASGMRPKILGREALQYILLDLLKTLDADDVLAGDCEPVGNYLRPKDVQDPTARERRLHQLSVELARIFIEYSFSRSTPVNGTTLNPAPFLSLWNDDDADLGAAHTSHVMASVERWQRAIWRRVFGPDGLLAGLNKARAEEQKPPYKTLVQVFDDFQHAQSVGRAPALPPTMYLVGFPHIARVFVEAVSLLGRMSNVRIFALAASGAAAAKLTADQPDYDNSAHPLLRLWGVAGAGHTRSWADLGVTPTVLNDAADSPSGTSATVLNALQRDILRGAAAPRPVAPPAEPAPQSIRYMECHSIAREIEAVADQIWILLENSRRAHTPRGTQSPSDAKKPEAPIPLQALRPDEIAVVIAGGDQQEYQTHIEQVFSGFHGLDRSYVGLPPATGSRALEAVQLLLALPFSRFRRRELLRLLVHPNLRGHLGPTPAAEWQKWAERLGILFGADRQEQAHTYLGDALTLGEGDDAKEYHWDLYNWEQGLRRLALGQCLSGALSGVDELFQVGDIHYIPLEAADTAAGEVARFSALASSLMADARWLRDGDNPLAEPVQRTIQQWAQLTEDYVQTYLRVTLPAAGDNIQQRKEDGYYLKAARGILRRIGEECPVEGEVSYRIFYEFARQALDDLQQAGGHELRGGVIVSTCLELRGIPFKHIFVVGLGAGQFPNAGYNNPLDLRAHAPQPGDLAQSDRDRYAFLETLLAARQSLTLSWVAREATTGEKLNASSVVHELRWVLEDRFGIAPGESQRPDPLTTRHKLRRYHPDYVTGDFPSSYDKPIPCDQTLHPHARVEARLHDVRKKAALGAINLDDIRKLHLAPEQWSRLRTALKLMALPSELADAPDKTTSEQNVAPAPGDTAQITGGIDLSQPQAPPEPRRIRISFSQLRAFLESPLQGAAKIQLGLKEDEDDLFATEREALVTTALTDSIIQRSTANQALARGIPKNELADFYDTLNLPRASIHGQLPAAYFLSPNRNAQIHTLTRWWKNFEKFNVDMPLRSIGVNRSDAQSIIKVPTLTITLTPEKHNISELTHVDLHGVTGPLQIDSNHQISNYTILDTDTGKTPRSKSVIDGILHWAVLLSLEEQGATGPFSHSAEPTLIINNQHPSPSTPDFTFTLHNSCFPNGDPRQYLEKLVADILCEPHEYLMPLDYIELLKDEGIETCNRQHLKTWIKKKLDDPYSRPKYVYGPIKDYHRFDAPTFDIKGTIIKRFPFWFSPDN